MQKKHFSPSIQHITSNILIIDQRKLKTISSEKETKKQSIQKLMLMQSVAKYPYKISNFKLVAKETFIRKERKTMQKQMDSFHSKVIKQSQLISEGIHNELISQERDSIRATEKQKIKTLECKKIAIYSKESKERMAIYKEDMKDLIQKVSIKFRQNPEKSFDQSQKNRMKTLPKMQIKSPLRQRLPVNIFDPFFQKHIKSECFYIMEMETLRGIVGNNFNKKLEIASLTKIMTFYAVKSIAKDQNLNLHQAKITIDSQVQIGGTKADLIQGQIYTVYQLLYGLMLPSGNDSAIVLSRWGGNILKQIRFGKKQWTKVRTFVQYMNKLANDIGMNNTTFDNVHGLPDPHNRSSCKDISKLCSICMQDEDFVKIVRSPFHRVMVQSSKGKKKGMKRWDNTNKLLRRPGFVGIKTGITITAGPCLASAYQFRDKTYITVLLRCNKLSRRFKETRLLLAHSLRLLAGDSLTENEQMTLKTLEQSNHDIDSDYSEDEEEFNFDVASHKQMRRRQNILTEL